MNDWGIWGRGSGATSLLTTCVCTAAFFPVFGVTFHIEGAGSSLSGCVCYLVYLFSAQMSAVICLLPSAVSIATSLAFVVCLSSLDLWTMLSKFDQCFAANDGTAIYRLHSLHHASRDESNMTIVTKRSHGLNSLLLCSIINVSILNSETNVCWYLKTQASGSGARALIYIAAFRCRWELEQYHPATPPLPTFGNTSPITHKPTPESST